jgi:hypothetical protein
MQSRPRDMLVIPPTEVSAWIKAEDIETYSGVVLATLVAYDTGKLISPTLSQPDPKADDVPVCTFDKEVHDIY